MHHLGVEEHEPAAGRNDMQNLRRGVAVGVRILGPWAAGRRRAASEAWRAGGGGSGRRSRGDEDVEDEEAE